jgi:hypothetical protein
LANHRRGPRLAGRGQRSHRISRRQPLRQRRSRANSQVKHLNAISTFAAEVRRDRFGVQGGLLYLNAQAGTDRSGLVSKVDLSLQQFIGQFFGSYRVIEGPRGWLDLLAGFRYTYLGEQVGLQANNVAVDGASTQLVNQFAQQVATPGSDLRTLIQQNIVDKLSALDGSSPKLPVVPSLPRRFERVLKPGLIR